MRNTKIRTAVVGAGKMGAVHAKVYHQLPASSLVAVVDIDAERAKHLAKKYRCCAFTDCVDILGKVDPVKSSWIRGTGGSSVQTFNGVDAVTIATPTVTHHELAKLFIGNNIAVMIEKPLAADIKQARDIAEFAKRQNCVVAVGHSERCNPVVQAIKRLHIEPKFIEATRISPYPFRSTDVGVVLDVMIHDIDIILSLAASKIVKVDAVGVGVIDQQEDICNARIVFENGCIANITASRLALKTERKVRVFSRQAYLSVDYFKKTGTVIKADPNIDVVKKIRQLKKGGKFGLLKTNWSKLLHIEKLNIDDKQPLVLEQESFLKAVADKSLKPEVSVQEALAAMECAQKILASVKKHKWD
jgi:predicted dehydrogenase